MKYYSKKQWTHKLTVMVLLAMALGGTAVQAMPSGGDIRSGQGSISQDGKNMTVLQNSDRMAIDWTKFDIAKDETVRYAQPDRNSISLNRVTGGQQSVIAGNLNANGNVVLVNPNGVVFTKNSSVDVGGLVASTARLNDEAMKNFGNGKDSLGLSLDKDSTASVINEGQIKAQGGLVALHAGNVENKGTITNEGGTLAMAAAKNLTLSAADDDKLNFTVDGDLAKAQALNSGSLKADGGYVVMTAKSAGDVLSTVVNNSGTIEAKTLRKNEKGQILLDGGDNGQVEVSGTLDASGTEKDQDAGNIKVIGQKTIVHDNTNLLAKGDNNGGKIETSGDVLSLGNGLTIDAKGTQGKAGEWLLDPLDVIIADSDPTTTSNYDNAEKKTAADSDFTNGSASIGYNDPDATTANASSVNSAVTWISTDMVEKMLNAGTNVTIQAAATNGSANIIVKNDIDKTAGDDATFTLDAMRNITVNGNITSTAGKLNVVLNADSNGDQIGAVIINANINTNGGDFTSASGGTVKYTSDSANTKGYGKGTLTGKADPAGHTVGTYFGHVDSSGTADGAKDDRLIKTSGGKITLNGEIAIGLNGGTLTLDSGGGDVTATGIINSGNSYGAYVYGTDTWDTLVEKTVESYLKSGSVPAYHYQGVNYVKNADGTYQYTTEAQSFSAGQPHYTFSEADTQNVRWLGDGSSTSVSVDKGTGYASVIITKGSMTLEQWLNYQLTYNTANFANRYISQDSGVKIETETVGNKTNTYVRNANGSNVTAAQFKTYLATALSNLQSDTASTDTTKMLNGETVYNNLKDDISHLLATNWFASKELAQGSTGGGSAVGDSYLATITTILENSLTTPNGQQILWAGGRGSGVLNKTGSTNNDKAYPYSYYGMPDDPTYQDGMYWVTGPEGEANNGKGTQFYSNANSDWKTGNYGETVYGYVNWDTYKDGNKTRSQPDNSAPFLTVGYGTTGKWDDAAMGGDTTVGFIKETNLANSSLNIKAGTGAVSLGGDIGKAKALDTVNIESTGAVTTGTTSTDVTKYHNGTIYADHGVYISGGTVSVGGEIHSGGADVETTRNTDASFKDYLDNVTIQSSGNLTVHGIEANASTDSDGNSTSRTDGEGGKIKLTSTGTDGVITLGDGVDYNGKNTNGGVLKAASTAQGAVVIDAQGSNGGFENRTSAEKAIVTGENVTGENGTWQIYSASPDKDIFGTNLNSGTDAQWTSKSTSNTIATENKYGKNPSSYSDTSNNKFIFQATPVITLYSEDYLKTYGDEVSADTLNGLLRGKEVFTGLDEKPHNVTDYSSAFQEKDYKEYIAGEDTVTITSGGSAATATRNGGKYEATDKSGKDGKNAVYDLTVNLNEAKALDGYAIDKENGKLEIKKRSVTITSSGEQTYGDSTYTSWSDKKSGFANDDENTFTYEHGIKSGSDYETNLNKTTGRTTADAGEYKDSVSYSNPTISGKKNPDGTDDTDFFNENYALDTTESKGSITVKKADLTLSLKDVSTTYGQGFDSSTYGYKKDAADLKGLANGDAAAAITDVLQDSDFTYVNGGAKSDPNNEDVKTQNAGSYQITGSTTKTLDNYNIKVVEGTSTVEKATLTVNPEDIKRIYGQAKEVQEDAKTAYNLSGFANGDTKDTVDATNKDGKTIDQLVTVTNDVSKALKDDGTHTQNASAAGYDMATTASGDLTNYNIMIGAPKKVYLDKAELVIDTDSNSKVYGNWQGVKNDVEGAAHIRDEATSVVNGDKAADLMQEMGLTTSSEALIKNADGTYKTNHVKDGGYAIDTTFADTITNYTVKRGVAGTETLTKAQATVDTDNVTTTYGTVDKNYTSHFNTVVNGDDANELLKQLNLSYSTEAYDKDGKPTNDVKKGGYDLFVTANGTLTHDDYNVTVKNANVTLNKAKLVIDTDNNTKVYGDWKGVKNDVEGAAHIRDEATSVVNGDKAADLMKEMGLTTSSEALIKNADGTYKTNHVKDGGYAIDTTFADTIKNYDVSRGIDGVETLTKAKAVVDTDKVTTTYGTVDKNYTSHFKNALNGDDAEQLLKNLSLTYKTDAYTDDTHTNNVKEGGYNLDVAKTADLEDYEVTVNPSNVTLEKATLVIDTTGGAKDYGDVAGVQADLDKAASFHVKGSDQKTVNGDDDRKIQDALKISVGSNALVDNGTRTNNVKDGGYDITVTNYTKELQNYKIETGTVGKEQLNRVDLYVDTNNLTKSYGDAQGVLDGLDSKERTALDGLVNGDDKQEDAIRNAIGIKNSSPAVYTKDGKSYTKDVGDYEIKTALTNQTITNYNVKTRNAGKVTLTPKSITVKNTMTQQYGSSEKKFSEATVPADQLANGDTISTKDLKFDIVSGGKYEQSLKENQAEHADAVSADAGNYTGELIHTGGGITHADGTDAYKNYKVTVDGDIVVTPADLTVKINDANTQYGTPFDEESGKKSYDYTVVSGNTNGDTKAEVKNLLGQLKNYKNAGVGDNGRATKDVGSYGITGEQDKKLSNYTVRVEKGTATITPAPLTIKTDHVHTDYGTDYDVTVGKTVSSVEGLTNGDQDKASDISYDYGNYGGGYIEGNTKTNHVGDYDFKTTVGNESGDFLKNYTISGGDATLTITPKDVYFHVDGKGSTFDDIIYTVTDPSHPGSRDAINSQLPYGETVTGGYGLGQALPGTPGSKDHYYTVDSTINGTPVYDNNGQGTQVGNYVYHPTGQAVIHFDPPQKPDQTTHYVEGARRPQDKIESALPVFRVDASGVVKQYGTYGIESKNQAVTLSPTGMRMPEPNQPSTQDRKYLTTLKTAHGHGTFRLEYNGVVLRVIPVDPAAEQIVTDGDKMKNVALSEQALHVAYTQMGLDLVNLKGVYIYMAPMSV